MARAVKFVDVPVSEDRDIIFNLSDRIIGVSITNQGSNTIKIAMGNQNAFKELEAGADTAYGDNNAGNDIFYLVGNLKIESPDWDQSKVVITLAYDVTDTQQEDC